MRGRHDLVVDRAPGLDGAPGGLEHTAVVAGHDLDDLGHGLFPAVQQPRRRPRSPSLPGACCRAPGPHAGPPRRAVRARPSRGSGASASIMPGSCTKAKPARHPGCEVAPRRAQHEHGATGHVLAGVVADSLDDSGGAGVAHAESFADLSADERRARGRPVEHDVAGDDLLLGAKRRAPPAAGPRGSRPRGPCPGSRWRRRRGSS